jgi:uncharacterized membrane protein (Fun14 family)
MYLYLSCHDLGAEDDDLPHSWVGVPLFLTTAGTACLSVVTFPSPAAAKDHEIDKLVDKFMNKAWSVLSALGLSGCIGVCVGKALKAMSGCLVLAIGVTFIGLQLYAHCTRQKWDFSCEIESFDKQELSNVLKAGLKILTQARSLTQSNCEVVHHNARDRNNMSHCDFDNAFQLWGYSC